MEIIKSPSGRIRRLMETLSHREAYQKIAEEYGGKAAGLMLSAFHLGSDPLLMLTEVPFGVALKRLSQNKVTISG